MFTFTIKLNRRHTLCPKKRLPLKSSASAERSNLNALTLTPK